MEKFKISDIGKATSDGNFVISPKDDDKEDFAWIGRYGGLGQKFFYIIESHGPIKENDTHSYALNMISKIKGELQPYSWFKNDSP